MNNVKGWRNTCTQKWILNFNFDNFQADGSIQSQGIYGAPAQSAAAMAAQLTNPYGVFLNSAGAGGTKQAQAALIAAAAAAQQQAAAAANGIKTTSKTDDDNNKVKKAKRPRGVMDTIGNFFKRLLGYPLN